MLATIENRKLYVYANARIIQTTALHSFRSLNTELPMQNFISNSHNAWKHWVADCTRPPTAASHECQSDLWGYKQGSKNILFSCEYHVYRYIFFFLFIYLFIYVSIFSLFEHRVLHSKFHFEFAQCLETLSGRVHKTANCRKPWMSIRPLRAQARFQQHSFLSCKYHIYFFAPWTPSARCKISCRIRTMPRKFEWQSAQDRQLPQVTDVNETSKGTSKVPKTFFSFL